MLVLVGLVWPAGVSSLSANIYNAERPATGIVINEAFLHRSRPSLEPPDGTVCARVCEVRAFPLDYVDLTYHGVDPRLRIIVVLTVKALGKSRHLRPEPCQLQIGAPLIGVLT